MSLLKQIFGSRPTTKVDVAIGVGAAIFGVLKAADTIHQYKKEQEEEQE